MEGLQSLADQDIVPVETIFFGAYQDGVNRSPSGADLSRGGVAVLEEHLAHLIYSSWVIFVIIIASKNHSCLKFQSSVLKILVSDCAGL